MNKSTKLYSSLIRFQNRPTERYCDLLSAQIILNADDMRTDDITQIMTLARNIDPTESNHAAHLRDTIRDNINPPFNF